jgi:hypothetical protein
MSDNIQQKIPQNKSRQRAASNRRMVSNKVAKEATGNPQELVSQRLAKEEPVPQKPRQMFSANRKRLVITI